MQDENDFSGAEGIPCGSDQDRQTNLDLFVNHARKYCNIIEQLAKAKDSNHYRLLFTTLSHLVSAFIQLPKSFSTRDEKYKSHLLTYEESRVLADKIRDQVHPECHAISEFHSGGQDLYEMLFDDLGDIYEDLQDGLRIMDLGTTEAHDDALRHWSFHFENHTARHLFRALSTIYEIMYHFNLFEIYHPDLFD